MILGLQLSRHEWTGELTLTKVRATLEEIVRVRAERGEKIYYLNGLELFDDRDATTMPDGIHPDAAGYKRIAGNFTSSAPQDWLLGIR